MTIDRLTHDLTLRDLSDPAHGPHAMQLLLDQVASALGTAWGVPADVIRTGPVVSIADNYDRLGYDAAAVTRDSRYSRYVDADTMLRSHTTAAIPRLLDALDNDADHDRVLVLPGLVYRRDTIDRTHVGEPHQVDLWRIRSAPELGDGELTEITGLLVDLEPWRPVSRLPAMRRDLSVVVDEDVDEESLGDAVRTALGDRTDDLESVELVAVTGWDDLPVAARTRLGLRPDQVNALVRRTRRLLSTTMTDD